MAVPKEGQKVEALGILCDGTAPAKINGAFGYINEMFEEQGAHDRTVSEVTKGIENLLEQAAHVVIVTNEIFSDAVVFDGDMDSYLEYLGKINQAAAQRADEVVEVIYGIPVFHKSADTCSNLCK